MNYWFFFLVKDWFSLPRTPEERHPAEPHRVHLAHRDLRNGERRPRRQESELQALLRRWRRCGKRKKEYLQLLHTTLDCMSNRSFIEGIEKQRKIVYCRTRIRRRRKRKRFRISTFFTIVCSSQERNVVWAIVTTPTARLYVSYLDICLEECHWKHCFVGLNCI